MKQLLTLFIICFCFKAFGQPSEKYWKVGATDTSSFVMSDTLFKYDTKPGWDTLSWQEDVAYTNARTVIGEVDTIRRQFFQLRVGRTSGYVQKRVCNIEKWLVDVPKSRAQQIMDSINAE